MSVFYRLSKVTSPKAKGYGKWYPRAVITQTVDTEMLAAIMQRNCTLKKADIVAVISELIETMADQLQDSKRVKLNGFGSFKIGIRGEGADSAADFSISKNIKGLHVLFQPEVKTDGSGLRQKTFITGCSVQEAPKNDVDTTKPANSGSNGGGNGGSTGSNTQPSTGGNGGGSHEPIGD
ncbi:DNA-binding protein, histone-like, putative [Xylanibacter ruminicola]|uniref:DNA-binding protein, histone-like, putative n=1 Tax=Xylanibacter ruminicola TaxID=839 RepID=A0A1M7GB47_XYLRU|nr:HU family DNA-binding protein [Xylanibacter ruminicola]SHM13461.1 DNA-binding protein, histone-like, putative [Xylanibacter ruminicola]